MKTVLQILICFVFSYSAFSQSLESGTLSWGGEVLQSGNFGGSTLGEYVINTSSFADGSFYHGFQFLGEVEISNYPACLNVTSTSSFGLGSLREAVACSFPHDVITFDDLLGNQSVLLATPAIIINKPLTFLGLDDNITLENLLLTNNQSLINIFEPLIINNLKVIGKSEDSLILELQNLGSIEMIEGEMNNLTINQ